MKITRTEVLAVVALMTVSGAVGAVAGASAGTLPTPLARLTNPSSLVRPANLPSGCTDRVDLDTDEADDEFRRALKKGRVTRYAATPK